MCLHDPLAHLRAEPDAGRVDRLLAPDDLIDGADFLPAFLDLAFGEA
jgi:hypothetical protein